MKLPDRLQNKKEWIFVGPMGPALPPHFSGRPVLLVDGGLHFCTSADLWVGDGDSSGTLSEELLAIRLPKEKDQSDLAVALSLFHEDQAELFHLWGFLGGRRDHELFNLGEAMRALNNQPGRSMLFYDHNGRKAFHLLGEGMWRFGHQGLFSLGTLKNATVTIRGEVSYPAHRVLLTSLSSVGLSNEANGEVELETSGPIFLYFPEAP